MSICDTVQECLAEGGIDVVREDGELHQHLEGCEDCQQVRDALLRLDEALGELPELDAPDDIVEDSLAAVAQAHAAKKSSFSFAAHRHQIAGALAASVAIVAVIGLFPDPIRSTFEEEKVVSAPTPKDVVVKQEQAAGKPPPAVQKIVEGKIEKYYATICLVDQPFVKNPDQTIKDVITAAVAKLGENIVVKRFIRYQIGA